MKSIFLLLALLSITLFTPSTGSSLISTLRGATSGEFSHYLRTHHKIYTADQLPLRYAQWTQSLQFVQQHNQRYSQGLESFNVEMNQFADWTDEEWQSYLTASPNNAPALPEVRTSTQKYIAPSALPTYVNWTEKGLVSAVKDQAQCGSCWTFSATGSMECAWALKYGATKMVVLSEQEYVDCLDKTKGCGGGWPTWVYQYVIANGGAMSEADYPYLGTDGHPCRSNKTDTVARFQSFVNITSGDELALTTAATLTPGVSVCIDASPRSFSLYKSGVYKNAQCKTKKDDLDHAVLVTGFGTDSATGLDYYLVKNSWGPKWGDMGYIKMYRDINNHTNNCGIATVAAYPIAI